MTRRRERDLNAQIERWMGALDVLKAQQIITRKQLDDISDQIHEAERSIDALIDEAREGAA